jgi:hypothetical protein
MTNDKAWLARQLYEMEIMPPSPSGDVRSDWLNFTCDLEVAGDVLNTFEDDVEAAVTVRDRLIGWSRIWGRWHPDPGYRPFYRAVAVAAEAGDWNGVSRLCQGLMEVEQRRLQQ